MDTKKNHSEKKSHYIKKLQIVIMMSLSVLLIYNLLNFKSVNAQYSISFFSCSRVFSDIRKWSYKSIIEPLFSDKDSNYACSAFKSEFFCITRSTPLNPARYAALKEYFSYDSSIRQYKDYGNHINLNKNALDYFCAEKYENQHHTNSFLFPDPPCPSTLRYQFPKAILSCANHKNPSKSQPFFNG